MSKWMPIATAFKGIREVKGHKENNETILQYFEDVGHGYVKNDEVPWCSAFVGAVFEECGIKGTGSLAARSWLKWGKKVTKPQYGDVVVFWRGKRNGWQGHVAFFVKQEGDYIYVLGGNQRNAVNVSRYNKNRLLGYRRPSSMSNSRTVAGGAAAAISTGGTAVIDTVQKTQETLAGVPLEIVQYALAAITMAGIAVVIYARWDDLRNKGR